jgi:hypothetical protein
MQIQFNTDKNTHEQAVSGALDKLKTTLETITGRLRNY